MQQAEMEYYGAKAAVIAYQQLLALILPDACVAGRSDQCCLLSGAAGRQE
jgi:hypothetical protein